MARLVSTKGRGTTMREVLSAILNRHCLAVLFVLFFAFGLSANLASHAQKLADKVPARRSDKVVENNMEKYRSAQKALKNGQPAQALEQLTPMAEGTPSDSIALKLRSQAYLQLGKRAEASQDIEAHLAALAAQGPEMLVVLHSLGLAGVPRGTRDGKSLPEMRRCHVCRNLAAQGAPVCKWCGIEQR